MNTKFFLLFKRPNPFPTKTRINPFRLDQKFYRFPYVGWTSQTEPCRAEGDSLVQSFEKNFGSSLWKKSVRKQRRDVLASIRGLQQIVFTTFLSISPFVLYGKFCSRPCFCLKQEVEYTFVQKTGKSKETSWLNSRSTSRLFKWKN